MVASFIGGAFVTPADASLQSLNPSDPSDVVALLTKGDRDEVDAAAMAAADSQTGWERTPAPSRADSLLKWAAAIDGRAEEFAQMICREVGKPIGEARGEVARCGMILRYFAGEAVRPCGDVIPAQTAGALQFSLRQALGVVGLITPWNFPLAIPIWKAAPALAFGNTVILKPAEASAKCGALLAETAPFPAGVFNVVQGGPDAGQAMVEHPLLNGLSFTGSSAVGRGVAMAGATRNLKVQTEMGGKNVAIVLADADLLQAAKLVAAGAMRYAGQKCTATSRVVVERAVADPFMELLREEVLALPLGPVLDPSAAVGPVISEESKARIEKTLSGVDRALEAQIPSALASGYFVCPTVVRETDPNSKLAQEEIFGPVLAMMTVEDLDHALALANGVRYGLSASLFTRDVSAALAYIDRIEAGMVRVNGDTTGVDPHAPFGGVKASSSGTREQGPAAREFYSEIKTVQINPTS